jgi:hypothetical protein
MNIVGLLNNINGGSYSFSVIKLKDWRTYWGWSICRCRGKTIICQDRKYERCENIILYASKY